MSKYDKYTNSSTCARSLEESIYILYIYIRIWLFTCVRTLDKIRTIVQYFRLPEQR